jgi:formylglycine-generating enzyme required for sulfatase activity
LNPKDDGEAIPKKILDWVTGVITLAAALSTIIGVFFSGDDQKIQRFAYIAALLLLIISGIVFFYQRRRAAKLKIAESPEPLSATAALRGLLPFEEGDQLPGRARDIQELYTLVSSSTFRFGILWGESGCGKTSLLRAGLTPKLRNEKFLPLYISKPTKAPQEAIRSVLYKEVQGLEKRSDKNLKSLLKTAAPKGKKIVILLDQFEEFFLTNRTPDSRAVFIKWLGGTVNDEDLPIAVLIGIRSDFFAHLQNFAPEISEPTSTHSTYQLENFDVDRAKQVLSAASKADAVSFEPALIDAVVRDLESEELIRPAELQIVGTRMKRKNIFSLNRYEIAGRARGLLSSYISEEIKQSANEQVARLLLRLMTAEVLETKSPNDLSLDEIARGISGVGQAGTATSLENPKEIQAILKQFVDARVLIHTDDDKYNLVHDYLASYVRVATEGVETNVERANRLLKRYIAEFQEDPKTRIPFRRAQWIQKYASPETKSSERAQELIKKSHQSFYATIAMAIVVGAALGTVYQSIIKTEFSLYAFLQGRSLVEQSNPFVSLKGGDMIFGSAFPPDPGTAEQSFDKPIQIEDYEILTKEVTNGEYRLCVQALACPEAPSPRDLYDSAEYVDFPAVNINAYQAEAFCEWMGGHLPTTYEWERAARGLEGSSWPWGEDQPDLSRANLVYPATIAVTLFPSSGFPSGASPQGVLNLVGNVWEWTRTVAAEDGSLIVEWDGQSLQQLVVRGGAFNYDLARITQAAKLPATTSDLALGFRCVQSP